MTNKIKQESKADMSDIKFIARFLFNRSHFAVLCLLNFTLIITIKVASLAMAEQYRNINGKLNYGDQQFLFP